MNDFSSASTIDGTTAVHVVVGSSGQFGRIIGSKLREDGVEIWGIDCRSGDDAETWDRWISGSIVEPAEDVLSAIERADVVWLCVSEPDILDALPLLASKLRASACVTDIASVKSRIAMTVERLEHLPGYLSIHPMFGPMDEFTGLNVLAVRLRENVATIALERMLQCWNVRMSYLTADEHDLLAAYVQALPHAILLAVGETLVRCGKDLATLSKAATPIQKLITVLLSRVVTNTSGAYWSVQAHNPYASRVRGEAQEALRKLDRLSEGQQQVEFERLLSELSILLRPCLPELSEVSTQIMEIVRDVSFDGTSPERR